MAAFRNFQAFHCQKLVDQCAAGRRAQRADHGGNPLSQPLPEDLALAEPRSLNSVLDQKHKLRFQPNLQQLSFHVCRM